MLDTGVVIAALDRRDRQHRRATSSLGALMERRSELLLSVVNYAEALVRPAEDVRTLQTAVEAIAALGIELVAPTAAVARDAARFTALGVSLADGFAMATAGAREATLASFDRRVRRALIRARIELEPTFA